MSKVALVTGASGGIGQAICLELAANGYDIAVHYNSNEQKAIKIKEEVQSLGQQAVVIKADLTNSKSCKQMIEECVSSLGSIYALVNNAGITNDGLVMRMTDEQYNTVIQANLSSCFFCTREAISYMLKAKQGRIVNIASVVGIVGNAGQANYAASKAGMIGFTKSCAKEVARKGICINAIAPGYIETAMTNKLSDEVKDKMKHAIPMRRFGRPEDVGGVVCFLCSDSASYITGQVMVVDGGMVI